MAKKKSAATKKTSAKARPAVKKAVPSPARKQAAAKNKPASKKAAKPTPKAKVAAKKPVKAAPKKVVKVAPRKVVKPAPKKAARSVVPAKRTAPISTARTPAKAALPVKQAPKVPPAKPVPAPKVKTPAPALTAPVAVKAAPLKAAALATPAKTVVVAPPAAKTPPAVKEKAARAEAKPKEPVIAVMTGIEPLGAPARTLKRPMKERFLLEFYLRATPSSLYDLISSPSGFSEWFCDDVDVRGDQFTFRWGNDEQVAQCLSRRFGELIRFQWANDEDPGSYFELRIRIDPMTNETCLVVTDHAWPKDMDEAKALWDSQIHTLQRVLGA